MIKISTYVNRLIKLPLPKRREVELVIKEIYQKGRADERRLSNKTPNRSIILPF